MAHRSLPDPSYMDMVLTTSAVCPHTMNNAAGGCQNTNCYKLFQVIGGIGAFGARKGFRSRHGMMTSVVPNA